MKIPNDYMEKSYRMEITEDKDEGGFVVFYPDMPGCITCGETVESAAANALPLNSNVIISFWDYIENYYLTLVRDTFIVVYVHE